ncbi:MAG TPA: UDP-N-acetylglucosamine 1-carboxyvinyltransferase [Lachnospiraceae bacterium]|nr:UDP-N-acetylglucosamine 1-carboxyvinyltransferase [Lachnospiraceae bacterium]
MDSIHIYGGEPLFGQVRVQGSKNAALPLLAATVLVRGISVLENCPRISDIFNMIKILDSMGAVVSWEGSTVIVDATNIKESRLPEEYVIRMRSSIVLMGALLGRVGEATMCYPGGCVIGKRPVDMHLDSMKQLGCDIEELDGGVIAKCSKKKPQGSVINLRISSVGVTENIILASVLADGVTIIKNAAREPEVHSLCLFLKNAGAMIEGIGSNILQIEGVNQLKGTTYKVPADRIVAGTYVLACMATGGVLQIQDAPISHLQSFLLEVSKMGATIQEDSGILTVAAPKRGKAIPYLETDIYPGFPTDLQSPLLVALAVSNGTSVIKETIFENRFRIVKELNLMGAKITVHGNVAYIEGVNQLEGKNVIAEELRGGAALILAGLAAKGITTINNKHFIDRGYENIEKDLRNLGAKIVTNEA